MPNILSARESRKAYKPLIQRMFPVDHAIQKMLSSRRSDERVEGIRSLARSGAPKATIAQRLRIAFYDDCMDCNIAALKAAVDGGILGPRIVASAIRVYERSAHFAFHYGGVGGWTGSVQYNREDVQRFALDVAASAERLDPAISRRAYEIRSYARRFSLRELFLPLTTGTGWKLPFDFEVVSSFESEDRHDGTVTVIDRGNWKPIFGKEYMDFADGKIIDAGILRLYAEQRGSPESRVAEAVLRKMLNMSRNLVHSDGSRAEIERTLEMMRYVQNSISGWLSANWTFAPFLFENSSINICLRLDILNYLQDQQCMTRLLLASGPTELRPFLLLHLGALSAIVDDIEAALLSAYRAKLRAGTTDWEIHELTQILYHYYTEQTVLMNEIRSRLTSIRGSRDIQKAFDLLSHLSYWNLCSMMDEMLSKLLILNKRDWFMRFFWRFMREPYNPFPETVIVMREKLFAAFNRWQDRISEADRNKMLEAFEKWRSKAENA